MSYYHRNHFLFHMPYQKNCFHSEFQYFLTKYLACIILIHINVEYILLMYVPYVKIKWRNGRIHLIHRIHRNHSPFLPWPYQYGVPIPYASRHGRTSKTIYRKAKWRISSRFLLPAGSWYFYLKTDSARYHIHVRRYKFLSEQTNSQSMTVFKTSISETILLNTSTVLEDRTTLRYQ